MSIRFASLTLHAPRFVRRIPVFSLIVAMRATWRQRRALSKLEPHLLEDVGLTPDMMKNEANRPFWDVPDHWYR